jgi:hypothetical protein
VLKTAIYPRAGWNIWFQRGMLAILGTLLVELVFFRGLWFLSLSLEGFAFFTPKSMSLTRRVRTNLESLSLHGA